MSIEGHCFGDLRGPWRSVFLGNLQKLQPDLADARVDQANLPGYAIGYINFASLLIRTAIIDANQFKLPGAGVDQAHDRTKGKVGVSGGEGLAIKSLAVGRLAAVKFGSVPVGIANPSLNRLGRFSLIGYEGSFHHWCNEEHQWNPSNCSPDHEEWLFHKCCFYATTSRKV